MLSAGTASAQNLGRPPDAGGMGTSPEMDSLLEVQRQAFDPKTHRVIPQAIFDYANELADTLTAEKKRRPIIFPIDTLSGFSQTLGFTGKPILRWVDGREGRDTPGPYYRDLFFRQIDYYLYPDTKPDFYDTRTPYLNLDYQIGPRNYQMINGIFARNINDRWNIAGRYAARSGNAPYTAFNTVNRSLNFNSYYRGPGRRYHTFAEVALRDNRDFINGGLPIPIGETPNRFLGKQQSDVFLNEAERQRLVRTIKVDQHYRLLGFRPFNDTTPDSLYTPSSRQLNLRLQAGITSQRYGFGDPDLGLNPFSTSAFVRPYPWVADSTSSLQDTIRSQENYIEGAISYKEGSVLMLQAGLGQKLITHRSDSFRLSDSRPILWAKVQFNTPRLWLQGEGRREGSTLFAAETYLGGSLRFNPFPKKERWTLRGAASVAGLNPSVYQQYYIPDSSQVFRANAALVNEAVIKAHAELRLGDKAEQDSLPRNFVALRGFLSRTTRPLYYSFEMEPLQGDNNTQVSWLGVRLSGRGRISRSLYAELEANAQQGSASGPLALLAYAQQIPNAYGRLGLYLEDRNTAYGKFRLGGELRGFTRYDAFGVDAFSGEFYPVGFRMEPYARLDLSLEITFKNAFLWFRMQHANELLVVPGYFTTPNYPEQERMFVAGISWTFFD
jgi:hypothetical protein